MHDSQLFKRIRSEMDRIRILDTHEHLYFPHQLAEMKKIDFGLLFTHYTNSDLISAGMPPDQMAEVGNMSSKLSPAEKWRLLKPWYAKAWNTAYCESIRIAMRDLFGIEDLSDKTVEPLSVKMNSVNRRTWTREVFDRAHIDIAMEQNLWTDIVYPRRRYPDIFLCDLADPFSNLEIAPLSKDSGIEVASLADYLRIIDHYFDRFADEATAYKISRAYSRPIFFAEVERAEAERVFDECLRAKDRSSVKGIPAADFAEASSPLRLEDFIIHYCIRSAGEHDLPVKIHTGIQDANSNDVTRSRPSLLINLFMKYPNVKFDIYHVAWPYSDELLAIAKQFPNVWVDFCWLWIINPPAARRYLHEALETIPVSKIHGFGGDFFFVEGSYGHCMIAKREIARVLAEKVEEGRFTEEYAVSVARLILRENALSHFRIEEKRKLVASRG